MGSFQGQELINLVLSAMMCKILESMESLFVAQNTSVFGVAFFFPLFSQNDVKPDYSLAVL